MNGRALLAWNLRHLRAERGLSQERLAAEAGIDRTYVGMLEREQASATLDAVDKLATVLGVELVAMFAKPPAGAEKPKPLRSGRRPKH